MLVSIIQLLAGFAALVLGGNWLVDGSSSLAVRFRISPLVIGMTIVAMGTSAPELLVSTVAAIEGNSGIALGNVLGSNIANIGLILGLTAVICPVVAKDRAVNKNSLVMIATALLLSAFALIGSDLVRVEGFAMVALLILFTVLSIRMGRKAGKEDSAQNPDAVMSLGKALLLVVLAVVALPVGAEYTVQGASAIAEFLGISDRVIGLTVVALGTSLPELIASVIAALKKEMDMSIGNIIGSNIFNVLCVLGVSVSIKPIEFTVSDYYASFAAMMVFYVLLYAALVAKGKIGRGLGALMLILYSVFIVTLF